MIRCKDCGATMVAVALGKDLETNTFVELYKCLECQHEDIIYYNCGIIHSDECIINKNCYSCKYSIKDVNVNIC